LEAEEIDTARREVLRAQRSALLGLRHDGVISDDVFDQLSVEIDGLLSGATDEFRLVVDAPPAEPE